MAPASANSKHEPDDEGTLHDIPYVTRSPVWNIFNVFLE
jgi:hypothetical protein